MDFPVPVNEARRLARLRQLCVVDTPPDPAFDLITEMASKVFDVPIALVSLIDNGRQWFKSRIGLDTNETPRSQAFCAYAILDQDVTVVPDALHDERFKAYATVLNAPFVRFYAGAPLITAEGLCLGTLCIVDIAPRNDFGPEQCQMLRTLANMVMLRMESLRTSGFVDPVMGPAQPRAPAGRHRAAPQRRHVRARHAGGAEGRPVRRCLLQRHRQGFRLPLCRRVHRARQGQAAGLAATRHAHLPHGRHAHRHAAAPARRRAHRPDAARHRGLRGATVGAGHPAQRQDHDWRAPLERRHGPARCAALADHGRRRGPAPGRRLALL
jgi:hypothetical protein